MPRLTVYHWLEKTFWTVTVPRCGGPNGRNRLVFSVRQHTYTDSPLADRAAQELCKKKPHPYDISWHTVVSRRTTHAHGIIFTASEEVWAIAKLSTPQNWPYLKQSFGESVWRRLSIALARDGTTQPASLFLVLYLLDPQSARTEWLLW